MSPLNSTLTASAARANFYQLLEEAADNWRQFTVKLRGKGSVVIMSEEEVEGWKETLDIMSNPKLVASIKQGMKSKKTYALGEVYKKLGWDKIK